MPELHARLRLVTGGGASENSPVRLRLATEGSPNAVSVRAYLHQAAEALGVRGDDLVDELERWAELPTRSGTLPEEAAYLDRFGGSAAELRARIEGFRQVAGVRPADFLALRDETVGRAGATDASSLLELRVEPLLDEPVRSRTAP
jgi:hypothetical protein